MLYASDIYSIYILGPAIYSRSRKISLPAGPRDHESRPSIDLQSLKIPQGAFGALEPEGSVAGSDICHRMRHPLPLQGAAFKASLMASAVLSHVSGLKKLAGLLHTIRIGINDLPSFASPNGQLRHTMTGRRAPHWNAIC